MVCRHATCVLYSEKPRGLKPVKYLKDGTNNYLAGIYTPASRLLSINFIIARCTQPSLASITRPCPFHNAGLEHYDLPVTPLFLLTSSFLRTVSLVNVSIDINFVIKSFCFCRKHYSSSYRPSLIRQIHLVFYIFSFVKYQPRKPEEGTGDRLQCICFSWKEKHSLAFRDSEIQKRCFIKRDTKQTVSKRFKAVSAFQ